MIDVQSFLQQLALCRHHVVVVVLRKARVHAIARLARFSVTDIVRKDNEIAVRVEQLTGAKQHVRKLWSKELPPGAAGAVKNQNGAGHFPFRIAFGLAQSPVVQPEFGKSLPALEMEIVAYVFAVLRRYLRLLCETRCGKTE